MPVLQSESATCPASSPRDCISCPDGSVVRTNTHAAADANFHLDAQPWPARDAVDFDRYMSTLA